MQVIGTRKRRASNGFVSVGDGDHVNRDTGVTLVRHEFFGEPTGGYEVRVPALNDGGYTVLGSRDTLAEAKRFGTECVVRMREVMTEAQNEALRIEFERTVELIGEVAPNRIAREFAEGTLMLAMRFRTEGDYGKAIGYANAAVISAYKSAEAHAR